MARFIADSMLGKLALWLRVLGYDVLYYPDIEDSKLIAIALSEGRIVLTRDHLLAKRRLIRGRTLLIKNNYPEAQLTEVVRRFGLEQAKPFSRCLRCNHRLSPVERESVKGLVPPYIYRTHRRFSRCEHCGRIYWAGTHRAHMVERLKGILHIDIE